MPETPPGQTGGVSNTGTINTSGGSVVGRDMTINTTTSTTSEMQIAFQPITDAVVKNAAPAMRPAAEATLSSLKKEVDKAENGEKADDSVIAGLVKGLVGLVPSAVSAVVGAFASPVLGAIAGPATKSLIDELGGNQQ